MNRNVLTRLAKEQEEEHEKKRRIKKYNKSWKAFQTLFLSVLLTLVLFFSPPSV